MEKRMCVAVIEVREIQECDLRKIWLAVLRTSERREKSWDKKRCEYKITVDKASTIECKRLPRGAREIVHLLLSNECVRDDALCWAKYYVENCYGRLDEE